MNNPTNTEAKTAKNGGSVSATANLHTIKRASDLLCFELLEYGEIGIIERVANLGALLSCLTLAVRKAQGGNLEDLKVLKIDSFIDELCRLPYFIESLTKIVGAVSHLQRTIEREMGI